MEVETKPSPLSAYDILGIIPNATQDDIRVAYRIMARRYHPDVSSDPDAKDLFISVTEAYELLSDVARRRKYDAVRKILQQEKQDEEERNNQYTNNPFMSSCGVHGMFSGSAVFYSATSMMFSVPRGQSGSVSIP